MRQTAKIFFPATEFCSNKQELLISSARMSLLPPSGVPLATPSVQLAVTTPRQVRFSAAFAGARVAISVAAIASGFSILFIEKSPWFWSLQRPVDTRSLADRFFVALAPSGDLFICAKHLFVGAKLRGMGCTHHAARRFEQRRPGYLVALECNRGCASAYLRSRALILAMAASISPARLAWASTGNPGYRIAPLLGRFGPRAGTCYFAPKICSLEPRPT